MKKYCNEITALLSWLAGVLGSICEKKIIFEILLSDYCIVVMKINLL